MFKNLSITFVTFFVALDIVGALPIYLAITHHLKIEEKQRILNTSMCVAFLVALLFIFIGEQIFIALSITLGDFKIAGGLVLLLISLTDLVGGPSSIHHSSSSTGVVPLAVPLITGPAIITSSILQVKNVGLWISLLALCLNYLLAWFILKHSALVTKWIGNDGSVIFSKIAALFLTSIGISMMRLGIIECFPKLAQ